MADDTKDATLRDKIALGGRVTKEAQFGTIVLDSTVEAAAAASAGSVYTMARIPSNARIHGLSRIAFDDLASSGSPTLDIGLKAVDSNVTTDADALNDGIDCASAAGTANVIKDIANNGKRAWEYVNGVTEDPGGFLDVTISVLDAAVNTGGTISLTLVYSTNA